MSEKTILQAAKDDVLAGLDKASSDYKIAALTKKEEKVLYDIVGNSKEIELEYSPTVLSPKKFFFPQEEVFLEYTADGKAAPKIEATPLVLFGIHPCEANAIKIMDEAFADSHGDPNYLAKREASIVICIDCKNVCDEDAFCYKVNSYHADRGYDLMLHDLGGVYAITVNTEKGKAFAEKYWTTEDVDKADFERYKLSKMKAFSKYTLFKEFEILTKQHEEKNAAFQNRLNRLEGEFDTNI